MIDYSVIIPAYNEEQHLPDALKILKEAMRSIAFLEGEIIVVDNNSDDKTAEVAKRAGAQVVFEAHNQISRARNRGAAAASGKYLVFLDADTHISSGILKQALGMLVSGSYYGGGVKVGFETQVPFAVRCFTALWNRNAPFRKWFAGCFIFCLKKAFDETGGFREDIYAAEEIYFAKKLARWGKKHKLKYGFIDFESIMTSPRKVESHSTIKVMLLMGLLGIFPFLLRFRRMCSFWYRRD
jgi:glycosyltransferase involved in cell wall biosynthesis